VTLVEAVYKALQVSLEKFGDFLREVAALVLVFIPLDLWRNEITWTRSVWVLAISAVIFVAGLGCEMTATVVKRARDLYEEVQENGSESRA
jgi:hypothetical protein